MKRSPELIRQILMCREAGAALDFDDQQWLNYHYQLLIEANLMNGHFINNTNVGGPRWNVKNLTWAGHELLDLIRDEDRWQAIMRVMNDLDCYSFEIIKQVAVQQMKL
jgi:hypothetical protein